MIRRCYPGGKTKAFNVTYDDGVLQDIPFVELLNYYDLKGTFNLNSGLMEQEFSWIHPCGMEIKRLSKAAASCLYDGHEVASHTLTHPYMENLSKEQIIDQMRQDRDNLQAIFRREISGFAVPFSYYSDLIEECAREVGFTYARISEESGCYFRNQNPFRWKAGIFHLSPGLMNFVDGFLASEDELAFCQIVGHSYDLDTEDLWQTMKDIFEKVSGDDQVLPMTTIELVRYLNAMDQVMIGEKSIYNPTTDELWFRKGTQCFALRPGETLQI